MGRFFPFHPPHRGQPVNIPGLAAGLRRLDNALSFLTVENGRVEWSADNIPHIIFGDDGSGSMPVEEDEDDPKSRYPYGNYPFGVWSHGNKVAIVSGLIYRGGYGYKVPSNEITITGDTWITLRISPGTEPGTDSLAIIGKPGGVIPRDADGYIYRGLHKFGLDKHKNAKWLEAGWIGGEIAMMGY